eukprot:5921493-Amphidinium_carterae.1
MHGSSFCCAGEEVVGHKLRDSNARMSRNMQETEGQRCTLGGKSATRTALPPSALLEICLNLLNMSSSKRKAACLSIVSAC